MKYVIEHEGKAYSPDGAIKVPTSSDEHNKAMEAQELEWLKNGPDRVFAYVRPPDKDLTERPGNAHFRDPEYRWSIRTWLGTVLAQGANCWVGKRKHVGFGGSYRRPVTATIFGYLYHGWYMESSGDYCRLKKAKKQ